jgi:hypothetical protein
MRLCYYELLIGWAKEHIASSTWGLSFLFAFTPLFQPLHTPWYNKTRIPKKAANQGPPERASMLIA